jgi:hypothetical protein
METGLTRAGLQEKNESVRGGAHRPRRKVLDLAAMKMKSKNEDRPQRVT